MDIFELLDELQVDLCSKQLEEVEEKFFKICSKLAGHARANTNKQIRLDEYVHELKLGLERSINIAQRLSANAIYFEYDLDNNWESAFFICEEYRPLEAEDDDWASEWSEHLEGPSLKEFAHIYALDSFDRSEEAIGSTIYLIARTIICYAKAYEELDDESSIAICIAFHDQDPIVRIKE